MANPVTSKEVRDRLSRAGKTITDVARELGVHRNAVDGVLTGRLKGTHGEAHKVAVALGLKEGVIVADDMPIADALKAVAAH